MAHLHEKSNIKLAFLLNFFFTIFELIWWFLTNSIAIMSDAIHDFWDTIAIWMAWYLEKKSKKNANENFSYWYKRFKVLWAFINCLILLSWSIFILIEAFKRIANPEPSNAIWMFWLAIIWVIVNAYAYFKTHKASSINERVVSLHLLEDVLWWVAVLVWSIIMYFTNWYIIDSLLSIWIATYILFWVFKNIKTTLLIFMESTPNNINMNEIKQWIEKINWVQKVHDLHIWSLDWEEILFTAHIITDNINIVKMKNEIKRYLQKEDINHSTLEFENKLCEIRH